METERIFTLGASTGGADALTRILTRLPADAPGTLIVQHMPGDLSEAVAGRLNAICDMDVRPAVDGDLVVPGRALIAPGDRHMLLRHSSEGYVVRIKDGPKVYRQRPSIEVLFHSVAKVAGSQAVGVLLTGMGFDGAGGMEALREAGARTIAQDEASCVVFGMPKEAIARGGVERIVSLDAIADTMMEFIRTSAETACSTLVDSLQ